MKQPVPIQMYTPQQVAMMLQLSKNTVYELIGRGEIVAKKLGKVYRVPVNSLSFAFTGLDRDLTRAEQEDLKVLPQVESTIRRIRKGR